MKFIHEALQIKSSPYLMTDMKSKENSEQVITITIIFFMQDAQQAPIAP